MFRQIKDLLRLFNGKCIIVEDDEPRYVLLSFEEYTALRGGSERSERLISAMVGLPEQEAGKEMEHLEEVNKETEMLYHAKGEASEVSEIALELPVEKERSEYRIEDIPF